MLASIILISIIGSFIGSFLGVLIYRLPRGETVIKGRSYCQSCFRHLGPLDLIPVISFASTLGKCRYCGAKLSLFYPFIEVLTGIIFALNLIYLLNQNGNLNYLFFASLIYYLILSSSLIVIFFTDLKSEIIPDKILIFLFASTFIFQVLISRGELLNHILSMIVSLFLFLLLFVVTKGRGMGFGDVKLSAILGLVLGFPAFVVALYVAFLTGSITSIILILCGKKKLHKDTIAFGPFMVIGIFAALYFSDLIVSKTLPFLIK